MYIARPFALNHSRQRSFESISEAAEYLENETDPEYIMRVEDWIAIGKIVEVDEAGNEAIPRVFSVVNAQQVIEKSFDIDSIL